MKKKDLIQRFQKCEENRGTFRKFFSEESEIKLFREFMQTEYFLSLSENDDVPYQSFYVYCDEKYNKEIQKWRQKVSKVGIWTFNPFLFTPGIGRPLRPFVDFFENKTPYSELFFEWFTELTKYNETILPNETWLDVFEQAEFDKGDLRNLAETCKTFADLIRKNSKLWSRAPFPPSKNDQSHPSSYRLHRIKMDGCIAAVAGLSDGFIACSFHDKKGVEIWNIQTGLLQTTLFKKFYITHLCCYRNHHYVCGAYDKDKQIFHIWRFDMFIIRNEKQVLGFRYQDHVTVPFSGYASHLKLQPLNSNDFILTYPSSSYYGSAYSLVTDKKNQQCWVLPRYRQDQFSEPKIRDSVVLPNDTVAVLYSREKEIVIWDIPSKTPKKIIKLESSPKDIAALSNGNVLCFYNKTLYMYDSQSGDLMNSVSFYSEIHDINVLKKDDILISSGLKSYIYDSANKKIKDAIPISVKDCNWGESNSNYFSLMPDSACVVFKQDQSIGVLQLFAAPALDDSSENRPTLSL